MAMDWSRPEPALIRSKWSHFISDPAICLHQIKKTASRGKLAILRSVYWRIFLGQLPPPSNKLALANPNLNSWTIHLETSRSEWEKLKIIYLRAPDGLWLQDSTDHSNQNSYQSKTHPSLRPVIPQNSQTIDVDVNNPLSHHDANPWKVWLNDLELRKTIQQDVIRTFPELDYFRQPRTQVMLTNILHVYCKVHDDVGYRQGMHELLGVLLETLDLDSLDDHPSLAQKPELIDQVLSRKFLEHDAFSLFSLLMRTMKNWYDSNLSVPILDLANSQTTPLTSVGFIPSQLDPIYSTLTDRDPDDPLVHPIVEKCASIFHVYLKQIDPKLWDHLEQLQIEPQLWGIRWLRLLFTREFNYQESILIWDAIFADDGGCLRLADFVCIAMLLRIRENLLESDYSSALQLILRFPQPDDGDSRIDLLLYQALLLSRLPTHPTALLIIRQNVDLKLFSRRSSSTPDSDSWFGPRRKTLCSPVANTQSSSSHRHPLQPAFNPFNAIQNHSPNEVQSPSTSKSSQSLSKSKNLLNALADLRKSYSSTASTETYSATSSCLTTQDSDHSPQVSKSNQTKSPQSERKTDCLANQQVGQAIGLCVDALEQRILKDPQMANSGQGLALGVLKHIRDVMLSGFSSGFDSNVTSPLIDYQSSTTRQPINDSPQDQSTSSQSLLTSESLSPQFKTLTINDRSVLDHPSLLTRNSSFPCEGPESVELCNTSMVKTPCKFSANLKGSSKLDPTKQITREPSASLSSSSSSSSSSSTSTSTSSPTLSTTISPSSTSSTSSTSSRIEGKIEKGDSLGIEEGRFQKIDEEEEIEDLAKRLTQQSSSVSPSITPSTFGTKLWIESKLLNLSFNQNLEF